TRRWLRSLRHRIRTWGATRCARPTARFRPSTAARLRRSRRSTPLAPPAATARPPPARLYGGTRVQVARGWIRTGDRFQSITRLSPYPDASLTHLLPGTMEIRWTLDR